MNLYSFFIKILCFIFFWCIFFLSYAGCPGSVEIGTQLFAIENSDKPVAEKLNRVQSLQQQFISCNYPKDSVYARILHRMGVYQFELKEDMNECIKNTIEAIHINLGNNKSALPSFVSNSYFNLGLYYKALLFYKEALQSFDSAAYFGGRYDNPESFIIESRLQRSNIYGRIGNHQKSIDEATLGLQLTKEIKDSINRALLLNERAQSLIDMQQYDKAAADLTESLTVLKSLGNVEDILADNYRIRATLYKFKADNNNAYSYYLKAIENRKIIGSAADLSADLIEMANFLTIEFKKHSEALQYYQKAVLIIDKENEIVLKAQVFNNIGALYKETNQLSKALSFYQKGLNVFVKGFSNTDINANPSELQSKLTADKQMLFILLTNKAEAFLLKFNETKNREYLTQSKKASLLTDKVIDEMRYEQGAEQTKLYWRNRTRNFFTNAIASAYESGDAEALLYYMEKSKAILLNDKLNELGAFAYLPSAETAREQELRINIISLQQQFSLLKPADRDYNSIQYELVSARDEFEKFITALEQQFPAYYQYKYSGIAVNISKLQPFLAEQKATYISYYETDSVIYAITVSEKGAKLFKLYFQNFRPASEQFLELCTDKSKLNSQYFNYVQLSYLMYNKLFAPLHITNTKVILSPDRVLLPFDAFVKDVKGDFFLLYDYTFSYTYSANYLLKAAKKGSDGDKDFLGIAPESFAKSFALTDLKGSGESVMEIKKDFSASSVLTTTSATRINFLTKAGGFKMLHIYAHAIADSTVTEPRLFLYDSAVSLSELQLMQNRPAQLVFLAACETNAGKQQMGEGVYSLARGFAIAGVPATVAALWKTDNEAMYRLSELFYQFIKKGMAKDEALRHAKIEFIRTGSKENRLPFYWASSVLLGNTSPVKFSSSVNYYFIFTGGALFFIIVLFWLHKKRRAAILQP
jgi:CHAT domain-containing protein/tetratricopeptide (TPR) repeat protein